MRRFLLRGLIALALVPNLFGQTASFDIATFVPPPGWKHINSPGLLTLQNTRTVQGRTQFCQIFIFASQTGSTNPAENFLAQWNRSVVALMPNASRPSARPESAGEGWTSLTDHADGMSQGLAMRVILLTTTKAARYASVMVTVSPNTYQPELMAFFQSLNFHYQPTGNNPVSPANPAGPS